LLTEIQLCLYDSVIMLNSPLEKAVAIMGSQVALAVACGVKQAHVWQWLNTTKHGVPPEHVINVSGATDWAITPNDLRPDLYPHPHDGLPDHLRAAA
jgi:DNA-binding transcriptional regulator YdaS (Cro superfamily)